MPGEGDVKDEGNEPQDEGPTIESLQKELATTLGTLEKERRKNAGLQAKLAPYGDRDPKEIEDAFKTLEELQKELEEEDAKGDGEEKKPSREMVALQQQLRQVQQDLEAHKKVAEEAQQQRAADLERFTKMEMENWATEALAAYVTDPSDLKVLKPHLLARMKAEETDNGTPVFRVIGDDGEPILVTKSGRSNDPKTIIKEYVGNDMRNEFPKNFAGTKASGGGMTGGDGIRDKDGEFTVKRDASEAEYQRVRALAQKEGKLPKIVD